MKFHKGLNIKTNLKMKGIGNKQVCKEKGTVGRERIGTAIFMLCLKMIMLKIKKNMIIYVCISLK